MAAFNVKGSVAALASVLVAASAASAAGTVSDPVQLKLTPRHGVSFDVGSKRAIAYYLGKGGLCDLTVLMSDASLHDEIKGAATRVTIPVIPTRSARIDTAEGKTLEFKCQPSASAMSVTVLEQVAFAANRK
ncbi:MAG: hypothetical protein KDJ37_05240 [Hyphomicrobiaceae bacterium]|nr:hypothetical protein [Hyphomicrobiaceae bacterium]